MEGIRLGVSRGRGAVRVGGAAHKADEQVALAARDGDARVPGLTGVSDGRASAQVDCPPAAALEPRATAIKVVRVVEEDVEGEDGAVHVWDELPLLAGGGRVLNEEDVGELHVFWQHRRTEVVLRQWTQDTLEDRRLQRVHNRWHLTQGKVCRRVPAMAVDVPPAGCRGSTTHGCQDCFARRGIEHIVDDPHLVEKRWGLGLGLGLGVG